MEKIIYVITGDTPYDYDNDRQILATCDNMEATKRAMVYFTSKGYDNLEYCRRPLKDYEDVDTSEVCYLYNVTCELKENLALGMVSYAYRGMSLIEKPERIGWSSGRRINGEPFFEVQLSLCLKTTLPDILAKEERQIIRNKIIELSKGQVWCEIKENDLW